MEKYKTVQEKKDLFIQFSEEEMQELGWEENQKLSMHVNEETGAITIKPWVKMEIEMDNWPKELMLFLIQESCEKDISVNEVITNVLEESLKNYDKFKS
jgi:isopentenyldiphosphate isomerase